MNPARHTNSLAKEKSPYLLQHAHNPVDWFPWGDHAFQMARAGDKPVFLSIGYSTCHWCHVMERETFEDEKVAAFLREHFVSIKVDREERPDVDKIYMNFVQSTAGGGGWPLNVFLMPDLKPFFGGTYFPPDNSRGRPGFLQLLRQIARLWCEHRAEIAASADELHARLELAAARDARVDSPLTPAVLRRALDQFKAAYDPVHGGFGGAPKFPQPSIPSLMLRAAKRFCDDAATQMVLHTCDAMAHGGIHDQLGGGFSRYAVDAQWLVPHFEKMLYDNAQLVQLYLDAHLVSQGQAPSTPSRVDYAAVARSTLDYVLRDLTHPDGGFYSAEDADSEGHEGKFYCWTREELAGLLSPEEFIVAANHFGITRQGNFEDHSHPSPLHGQNVLSVVNANVPCGDIPLLDAAKAKMLASRARRIRPHLDDKVLTSWNGLMLGALARASVVLDDARFLEAAEKNLRFLREKLWQAPLSDRSGIENTGMLFHRWREGERDHVQLLEDYAFLLDGVIQLYEAALKPAHLDFACDLAMSMISRFYDSTNGGFWQSPAGRVDLILRMKDDYDGAQPSGNSVAALALLKLAAITGREDFRRPAESTLQLAAGQLHDLPSAMAFMLHALDFWLDEPRRVMIVGTRGKSKDLHALIRAAHSVYQPNKIVLGNAGAVEAFAKTLTAMNHPSAYVCVGTACQLPSSEPEQVREFLG